MPARLERQALRRKASQQRASKRAARREEWSKLHPALGPLWSLLRAILIVGGLVVGAALVFGVGTTVADRYGTAILAAAHDPKPIFDAIVWWQWIADLFGRLDRLVRCQGRLGSPGGRRRTSRRGERLIAGKHGVRWRA